MADVRELKKIVLDGVEYIRADSITEGAPIPGKRAVLVLDRGWIVAGDVTEIDGRIRLTRAVHVCSWREIGFDGMIANPLSSKVTLRPVPNGFDCPADAELFRVPVADNWGV